jgi:hypothetical protein
MPEKRSRYAFPRLRRPGAAFHEIQWLDRYILSARIDVVFSGAIAERECQNDALQVAEKAEQIRSNTWMIGLVE